MVSLLKIENQKNSYRLFFNAFSNDTRFKIIKLLSAKSLNVTQICELTGFEQSRVSHNLKCLLNCGFLKVFNDKNFRRYEIDEQIKEIITLFDSHIKRYEKKIQTCNILKNEKKI